MIWKVSKHIWTSLYALNLANPPFMRICCEFENWHDEAVCLESFFYKNLAIRKVFAFSDSAHNTNKKTGGWGPKHQHTSTEYLRRTSVCAGMYDKMNTCNDWRVGCKGRFQTSARLCCQSQSQGSTPVLIMSVALGCVTLWSWLWLMKKTK